VGRDLSNRGAAGAVQSEVQRKGYTIGASERTSLHCGSAGARVNLEHS
jgi:hypothetical protein